MKTIKTNGKLYLKEVTFKEYVEKIVVKNNNTSGKIQLPKEWIGKKVCIVLLGEKDDG